MILENNSTSNLHKHEDNSIPGKGRIFMKSRYFLIISMSSYKNRCIEQSIFLMLTHTYYL